MILLCVVNFIHYIAESDVVHGAFSLRERAFKYLFRAIAVRRLSEIYGLTNPHINLAFIAILTHIPTCIVFSFRFWFPAASQKKKGLFFFPCTFTGQYSSPHTTALLCVIVFVRFCRNAIFYFSRQPFNNTVKISFCYQEKKKPFPCIVAQL